MTKVKEFCAELERWHIKASVFWGKLKLTGGDDRAREYFTNMFRSRSKMEAHIILELSKNDPDLAYAIEERAAMRQADGLPSDLFSAILCNLD